MVSMFLCRYSGKNEKAIKEYIKNQEKEDMISDK